MKSRNFVRYGIIFLIPLAFTITQCFNRTEPATVATTAVAPTFNDPRGPSFAGSATCIKCHGAVADGYFHSNHFQTSRPASLETVHGSFKTGSNIVKYAGTAKVIMEKNGDRLLQNYYDNGTLKQKEPFDIVFGNKQAETYLYWDGKYVLELPVTYYKNLNAWGNSPGLSGTTPAYTRLINTPCFECHASYIKPTAPNDEVTPNGKNMTVRLAGLDKGSMLLGLDCERCHGGGAQHVTFQMQHPEEKQSLFIAKIGTLTRDQRTDMCGQCHSGINTMQLSTFDFKPGDKLANYKDPTAPPAAPAGDVHGNQVGLLSSSQCFIKGTIECGTCHKLHNTQVVNLKAYSQLCINCHKDTKHTFDGVAAQFANAVKSNCVDCHMPAKSSQTIGVRGNGGLVGHPFIARSHRITVYPEQTKKVLAMLKSGIYKPIIN